MKPKIAFVYVWANAPIRPNIQRMLEQAFPEYEVEPVGIGKLLKQRPVRMALNELAVARYYGLDILKGKKRHGEYMIATPYLFHQVRKMMLKVLLNRPERYAFTFQFQSLFDTSLPGVPNFVYTDRTVQANLAYPGADSSSLYIPAWIELERQIYANASRVFTFSRYICDSLVEDYHCPPEKAVCVYAGNNTHSRPESSDPARESKQNILFVGIDWLRKGGPDLVEAFRLVLERCPDATLTIIGSSPKIDLPHVRVLGQIPLEELTPYYQAASIFCMPTKSEAFGVVYVEAMGNGLPIVATRLGAIPDFVREGENGYLTAPGDVQAIASGLVDLLENPEKRRAFGEKSREIWREQYNWENTGRLIRESVLDVLKNDG